MKSNLGSSSEPRPFLRQDFYSAGSWYKPKVTLSNEFPYYARVQRISLQDEAITKVEAVEAECRDCMKLIGERDEREEVIDKILDEVLGLDRTEWSSAYGYKDAIIEVQDRMHALTSPPIAGEAQEPNAKTLQAIEDSYTGHGVETADSVDALFQALGGEQEAVRGLVEKWRDRAKAIRVSGTWSGDYVAGFIRDCADDLERALSATPADATAKAQKEVGTIIRAIAEIVNAPQTDKQEADEVIPRPFVMDRVLAIRDATYRLAALHPARQEKGNG